MPCFSNHPYQKLRQFLLHGQLYQLVPDDLELHLGQVLQSLLDVVLQSQCLCRRGEVHQDVVRLFQCLLGVVHPGGVRLRRLDEVLLGVLGDPCPGSKRKDCCQDEPLGVECPCPGSTKTDCCLGAGFQPVESALLVPQVLLELLGQEFRPLALEQQVLLVRELAVLQSRLQGQAQKQALQPLSWGPSQPLGTLPLAWLLLEGQWWMNHP